MSQAFKESESTKQEPSAQKEKAASEARDADSADKEISGLGSTEHADTLPQAELMRAQAAAKELIQDKDGADVVCPTVDVEELQRKCDGLQRDAEQAENMAVAVSAMVDAAAARPGTCSELSENHSNGNPIPNVQVLEIYATDTLFEKTAPLLFAHTYDGSRYGMGQLRWAEGAQWAGALRGFALRLLPRRAIWMGFGYGNLCGICRGLS